MRHLEPEDDEDFKLDFMQICCDVLHVAFFVNLCQLLNNGLLEMFSELLVISLTKSTPPRCLLQIEFQSIPAKERWNVQVTMMSGRSYC